MGLRRVQVWAQSEQRVKMRACGSGGLSRCLRFPTLPDFHAHCSSQSVGSKSGVTRCCGGIADFGGERGTVNSPALVSGMVLEVSSVEQPGSAATLERTPGRGVASRSRGGDGVPHWAFALSFDYRRYSVVAQRLL